MPPKKPTPKSAKKAASADDVSSTETTKEAPRSTSADSVSQTVVSDGDMSISEPGETVQVVVRMRPFNTKEKNEKRGPCIELDYKLRQARFQMQLQSIFFSILALFRTYYQIRLRLAGCDNEQCRPWNPAPLLHL